MNTLPLQRYQFEVVLDNPLQLDFYSGSLLRGVFGHAFKATVCPNRQPCTSVCQQAGSCLYAQFFDSPTLAHPLQPFSHIPKPFVIEPPPLGAKYYAAGDCLQFSMVLMGDFIEQVNLMVVAWQKAFAWGIGASNITGRLQAVYAVGADGQQTAVYGQGRVFNPGLPVISVAAEGMVPDVVGVVFETPTSIKKWGKPVRGNLSARDFLMALLRRYFLLVEFYGQDFQKPDFAALAKQCDQVAGYCELQPCPWRRYSSSTDSKMTFDGMVGRLRLTGGLNQLLWQVLYGGQWFHVGNKTTFGMGKYRLIMLSNQ